MNTALRATSKGALYVEREGDCTTAVRLVPPRCWASSPEGTPLWSAVRGPRFSLGRALRELVNEDAGRLAAWALEGPERLTFAVQRDARGAWRLFDRKGEQNRAPSARARAWADDVVRRLNGPDVWRRQRAAKEETPCTSSSSTTTAA